VAESATVLTVMLSSDANAEAAGKLPCKLMSAELEETERVEEGVEMERAARWADRLAVVGECLSCEMEMRADGSSWGDKTFTFAKEPRPGSGEMFSCPNVCGTKRGEFCNTYSS